MVHLPLILVEALLVFGGALAFAWWQFRDLRREREKRERRQQIEAAQPSPSTGPGDAA